MKVNEMKVFKIKVFASGSEFDSMYIAVEDFSDALDFALKRVDIEQSKKENKGLEISIGGITEEFDLEFCA